MSAGLGTEPQSTVFRLHKTVELFLDKAPISMNIGYPAIGRVAAMGNATSRLARIYLVVWGIGMTQPSLV